MMLMAHRLYLLGRPCSGAQAAADHHGMQCDVDRQRVDGWNHALARSWDGLNETNVSEQPSGLRGLAFRPRQALSLRDWP